MNGSQYGRTIHTISSAMPAFRSIISINIGMFASALKNGGTEAQKAEWLPRVASGEIACFGLTEPGSGSDSAGLQTTATQPDNRWVLTGTKRHHTTSPHAKGGPHLARPLTETSPKNPPA